MPEQSFTVTNGVPRRFAKEHEFGMTLTIFFCPECGTTLWKEASADAFKGVKLIQAGTLTDKSILNQTMDAELYTTERVTWLASIGRADQKEQF